MAPRRGHRPGSSPRFRSRSEIRHRSGRRRLRSSARFPRTRGCEDRVRRLGVREAGEARLSDRRTGGGGRAFPGRRREVHVDGLSRVDARSFGNGDRIDGNEDDYSPPDWKLEVTRRYRRMRRRWATKSACRGVALWISFPPSPPSSTPCASRSIASPRLIRRRAGKFGP